MRPHPPSPLPATRLFSPAQAPGQPGPPQRQLKGLSASLAAARPATPPSAGCLFSFAVYGHRDPRFLHGLGPAKRRTPCNGDQNREVEPHNGIKRGRGAEADPADQQPASSRPRGRLQIACIRTPMIRPRWRGLKGRMSRITGSHAIVRLSANHTGIEHDDAGPQRRHLREDRRPDVPDHRGDDHDAGSSIRIPDRVMMMELMNAPAATLPIR